MRKVVIRDVGQGTCCSETCSPAAVRPAVASEKSGPKVAGRRHGLLTGKQVNRIQPWLLPYQELVTYSMTFDTLYVCPLGFVLFLALSI